MRFFTIILIFVLLFANLANAQAVKVIPNKAKERVDIEIGGKLFISYRWDARIMRPVLLPVMTAGGGFITRGF